MINNLLAMLNNELVMQHKKDFTFKIPDEILNDKEKFEEFEKSINDFDFKDYDYSLSYLRGVVIFWLKKWVYKNYIEKEI